MEAVGARGSVLRVSFSVIAKGFYNPCIEGDFCLGQFGGGEPAAPTSIRDPISGIMRL